MPILSIFKSTVLLLFFVFSSCKGQQKETNSISTAQDASPAPIKVAANRTEAYLPLLKGKRVGGMEFSTKHANFLVNADYGTYEDAISLIQEAQKRVQEHFDIFLECEIVILDRDFI